MKACLYPANILIAEGMDYETAKKALEQAKKSPASKYLDFEIKKFSYDSADCDLVASLKIPRQEFLASFEQWCIDTDK